MSPEEFREIERRWLDVPPPYDEGLARLAQMDVLRLLAELVKFEPVTWVAEAGSRFFRVREGS